MSDSRFKRTASRLAKNLFRAGIPVGALLCVVGLTGCGPQTQAAGGGAPLDLLAQVKKRGVVRVGVKADAPPFGVQDRHGRYGFDIDIAQALKDELGIEKIEFVSVTSGDRIEKVLSGTVDMVVASMTITRGRDEQIDFTMPYFQEGQGLLVRADSAIGGYQDLAGKTVGGAKGATSVRNIKQFQPDCKVREYPGYKEALAGLAAGEVDAVTSDMLILVGLRFSAANPKDFKIAGDRFGAEPYGIAVAENQSNWRDALNEALQQLWESGRWQRIFENWFGENARYRSDVQFTIVPFPK